MSELIELLKTFKGGSSDEKEITGQFAELAKEILYGGHIIVSHAEETRNIYPEIIEFYYHEENGSIKDPIMYHTNFHAPKGTTYPYFECSRLNLHQSGIDVTFEDGEKQYRASFLIRAYSVDNGEVETRSTYLYDAMFDMPLPFTIEWKQEEIAKDDRKLKGFWRQNVAKYEQDENGDYMKKNGTYEKMTAKGTEDEKDIFSYNGKKYVKCDRMWRFEKGKFEGV